MLYPESLENQRERFVALIALITDAINMARSNGFSTERLEKKKLEMVGQLEKVISEIEKMKA